MLMNKEDSLLLIIDVQEKLAPAMASPREVINSCSQLLNVAKVLGVPCIITEQYSKGLGRTMVDLRGIVGDDFEYLEKLEFSCVKSSVVFDAIKKTNKKQIILAGVETHICITQTALDLKNAGYDVFVVSNACSSRDPIQNVLGLQRVMNNGVEVVSSEMVVFEWLGKAGTAEFKEISKKYII